RRHLPGVPAALPADHDDHHGGAAGWNSAGAGDRDRQRAAAAAGHLHRGRAAHLADPHPLHHAGRLSLHGPPRRVAAAEEARRRGGARAMNVSAPFIRRPVATTLLALAVVLAGSAAFTQLPVAPLPRTDNPTLNVNAGLPGGSP